MVWLVILAFLVSGTYSQVVQKICYDLGAPGLHGDEHTFAKPYFFTLLMFLGEAVCLAIHFAMQFYANRQAARGSLNGEQRELLLASEQLEKQQQPSPQAQAQQSAGPKPPIWFYIFLSSFDLIGSTMAGVGLKWIAVSTSQMLSGARIFFTGIFSLWILKKALSRGQWSGIGSVIVGLILVGLSGALDPHATHKNVSTLETVGGILLVLFGSSFNSMQGVWEEKLMKGFGFSKVDPMELVGWEGVFGSILSGIMVLIVHFIPGGDCTRVENAEDTFLLLRNGRLLGLCLGYALVLTFFNFCAQTISKMISAVVRMMVNTCRTMTIWIVMVIIYYGITDRSYGESVSNYTILKLSGFAFVVAGTVYYVYSRDNPAKPAAAAAPLDPQQPSQLGPQLSMTAPR